MNQLYEKKCDCQQYDDDHRSALIKMELPEYQESRSDSTSDSIYHGIRIVFYALVLVLLGYSLWRIHEIESAINASDRYVNITRLLALQQSNSLNHHRLTRSVERHYQYDLNGIAGYDKEMPRGMMLTSKNEGPQVQKKLMNKSEFTQLVNSLFDKIQMMHNDTDRMHVDNNMKAVFQAWLPVFDALLPRELTENEAIRVTRSVDDSSEESLKKKSNPMKTGSPDKKSSEESSEETKPRNARSAGVGNEETEEKIKPTEKSSEESSEENKPRKSRSIQPGTEESTENLEQIVESSEDSNEESGEEIEDKSRGSEEEYQTAEDCRTSGKESNGNKTRKTRSVDSNEESLEKRKNKKYKDEFLRIQKAQYLPFKTKSSEESSESSESSQSSDSSEKPKNLRNFIYQSL